MAIVIKSLTKNIFILNVIVVLAFVVISCEDADDGGVNIPLDSSYTLAGTSWKLAAVVDVTSGASRELNCVEYVVCGVDSYTLTFANDSLASGRSGMNQLFGQYVADYRADTLFWHEAIWTMVCCDGNDGAIYRHALTGGLNKSRFFKLYSQELRIFYNDSKEYLKFKKIE
jgi:heat shock protein HslJ